MQVEEVTLNIGDYVYLGDTELVAGWVMGHEMIQGKTYTLRVLVYPYMDYYNDTPSLVFRIVLMGLGGWPTRDYYDRDSLNRDWREVITSVI